MTNKKFSNDLQSQVIDFIRFPLIVGVVFIHNQATNTTLFGENLGTDSYLPAFEHCSTLFSNVLGTVAVPLFYFMSGFLFFMSVRKFDQSSYKTKLQSRIKTLLVPYLFWNLVALVLLYFVRKFGFSSTHPRSIDLQYLVDCFWGKMNVKGTMSYPASYQFWFIRDLIVAVVLAPIIYFFCKKIRIYGIILLGSLWLAGLWFKNLGMWGFSSSCIFFFTAGAYMGINKRNLIEDFRKIRNLSFVIYPLFALADLLTKQYGFNAYVHKAGIIIGIIFCFNLISFLFEKGKLKPVSFLSAASFFVFAVHDPFVLAPLRKISFLLLRPENDLLITGLYFFNVIFAIIVALGWYYVMLRFVSKFCRIITGGR
jgi:fucose 4-O-acetylase-like acetyltransferase